MSIKVAIVDSGISLSHPKMSKIDIFNKYNVIDQTEDIVDNIGHGTAVTGIIVSREENISISVVKIYQQELQTELQILLSALEYVYTNVECDILHLSLGIGYYNKELYELCNAIYKRGTIIVAAFDNSGAVSFPAAFDCVIGVEASAECHKASDFLFFDDDMVDVYAKGGIHRVAWTVPQYTIQQGNSMSAAYVTGALCKNYVQNMNKTKALQILKQVSTYIYPTLSTFGAIKKQNFIVTQMKRVAIFPYNKEMSSLVNYTFMLDFYIADIYTCPFLGNMKKKIKGIYGGEVYELKNIADIDYSMIDTLIIGHLNALERLSGIQYKRRLLKDCLQNGINVFMFDSYGVEEFPDLFQEKGLFLYAPDQFTKMMPQRKGKLFQIEAPVLGVFGTSSKQGKFTLQLQLRNIFKERGYDVAQVASEPNAPLFGIEACVPFGYNSSVKLSEYEFISYLNGLMMQLDVGEPDIIVVGAQSGTVPEAYFHLGQVPMRSLEFLMGTNPDAVILCVNPMEDLRYIKRTIEVIENLVDAKVLALAIFPFLCENGWSYATGNYAKLDAEGVATLKSLYRKKLNVSSYVIGDVDEGNSIVDLILEYYTEESN